MGTVQDRLEKARLKANRSIRSLQLELHDDLKVPGSSYGNVHAIFKGRTEPSLAFVEAAAKVLGARPAWIAFEDGEIDATRQAAASRRDPTDEQLDRAAGKIPDSEWDEGMVQVRELLAALRLLNAVGVARDVLQEYWFLLLDRRDDLPEAAEGIAAHLRTRFPNTVALMASHAPAGRTSMSTLVDDARVGLVVHGEAVAAYSLDLIGQPYQPRSDGDGE
jgi:hypothetical protein